MADKPFPTSEPEVNLLLQNMALKLPALKSVLPITQTDIDYVTKAALIYQYLLTAAQVVSDSKEAFTSYKNAVFTGNPNAPVPIAPVFPVIATPEPAVSGIEVTLRAIIRRIKTAAGYDQTIGEELGLVETGGSPISPNLLVAELKCRALADGKVEIVFLKQGQDAMRVEFQDKGDAGWTLAGDYTSSPAIHDKPSTPPGNPVARAYRGILAKKNSPVGQWSPTYNVVTTP